jgi:TldD protein
VFDNGRLKTANFNTDQGFGLRAVAGEATGYAHSSELTEQALCCAPATRCQPSRKAIPARWRQRRSAPTRHLYGEDQPDPVARL